MTARLAILLSCLLTSFAGAPASAASFDCDKATTDAEIAVCDNIQLSQMDEELARLYKDALEVAPSKAALRTQQRDWITQRDDCGSDEDCLIGAYARRIDELQAEL